MGHSPVVTESASITYGPATVAKSGGGGGYGVATTWRPAITVSEVWLQQQQKCFQIQKLERGWGHQDLEVGSGHSRSHNYYRVDPVLKLCSG